MKILVTLQALRPVWNPKLLRKSFHKDGRAFASLDLSDLEAINRCEKEVPEYFNFANDVLDKWSKIEKEGSRPPNPALWWINGEGSEVRWSYEELGALSRKAANILRDPCGLQRGDRVILILPRVPEWWLLNVACIRTGIVFIPGTPLLTAKDIQYRLQASKAKCIITSEHLAPAVDSVSSSCPFLRTKLLVSEGRRDGWLNFQELFQVAPSSHTCIKTKSDEPMIVYFTSGTTGPPKMAEHSHSSYGIGCALTARYWLDLKPSDILWNMSDTGWVKAAIGSVFAPWLRGSSVFIHHMPQFDPRETLNTLARYPVTTMCSAPTVYRMLVQQDLTRYRFKSLSHCLTGGEPLNPEVMVQWKKQTGLDLYEGYGQTEVGVISVTEKGKKIKPGSMGKPIPPYDVQDNPKKTASAFRGNFYVTGDRGWMDEDGYRIGPFEAENALIEHPAVVESAVVSSPDPTRGEVVKAFVVLSPSFTSHDLEKLTLELQDHVKKITAPYKYPRKVRRI
ncbi:UNVERIFIED_CONTAM: Acyl-coenzyme A synthetase acsm4, mitochondrial [Gekko kuhli]